MGCGGVKKSGNNGKGFKEELLLGEIPPKCCHHFTLL